MYQKYDKKDMVIVKKNISWSIKIHVFEMKMHGTDDFGITKISGIEGKICTS